MPKYSYKINGVEEAISIAFNNTPDGYIEHTGFDFDGPIPGFWVGKFETGYDGVNSTSDVQTDVNKVDTSKIIINKMIISIIIPRMFNM